MFSNFPSSDEETAAAALLLLLLSSPSLPFSCSSSSQHLGFVIQDEDDDASSCTSASIPDSSSALTSHRRFHCDPILLLASATREVAKKRLPIYDYFSTDPKRKIRSVLNYKHRSKWEKIFLFKDESNAYLREDEEDRDTTTSSTITSSKSSSVASCSSYFGTTNDRYFFRKLLCRDVCREDSPGENMKLRKKKNNKKKKLFERKTGCKEASAARENWSAKSSSGVRKQVEAIKGLLREKGCASEVAIREVLGNSPDTSKALRILLKLQDVTRTGSGGRSDPFLYRMSFHLGQKNYVWEPL